MKLSQLFNCVAVFSLHSVCGVTRFLQVWKMAKNSHSYHAVVIFLTCCVSLQACADDLQCIHGTYAEYGTMLRGHVFQEHNATNILACNLLCNSNIRCQSTNYVISGHSCELNSRTKEATPEDYVQDANRVYLTRHNERGIELKKKNFKTSQKLNKNKTDQKTSKNLFQLTQLNGEVVENDKLRFIVCQRG